ncbi:hypothetical protein FACS1894186_4180 [Alphaproteobacteria bacterium]|nr:hypothetical protein FACS1894186_4180 [Alphaproteobacteria bacterium]
MSGAFAVIKKRRDFLRASASPIHGVGGGAVVQCAAGGQGSARFGFTASRKVGGAVVRNRAKRRLREIVRLHLVKKASAGCDYVLIARFATAVMPFSVLVNDVKRSMARCAKSFPA